MNASNHPDPSHDPGTMSWLRRQAISLTYVEAGNSFADLQPLKETLRDVTVIGLGESTHGTREFILIRHRLIEFLVVEMGFRLVAIESSASACEPINAYVLSGDGDLADVLSGQWYIPWDTEEFTAMLRWMRAYNQSVPETERVQFHGLDINHNEHGRRAVLAFLQAVAPERVAEITALLSAQAAEEAKWPLRIDDDARASIVALIPQVQALIAFLRENTPGFGRLTSAVKVEQIIQHVHVFEQWLLANAGAALQPEVGQEIERSAAMGENFLRLMDRQPAGTRAIVWLHDTHICAEAPWDTTSHLGSLLRQRYGERYYALGLEFGGGSFLARTALQDGRVGDCRIVTLPPAPAGTLPWYLSQVSPGALLLDLRAPVDDAAIAAWLQAPQMIYSAGWIPGDEETFRNQWLVPAMFDGIVFFNVTTPIRLTENARTAVAARERL